MAKDSDQQDIPSARLIIFALLQELFSSRAHHGARQYALEVSISLQASNEPLQPNQLSQETTLNSLEKSVLSLL